MHWNCSIEIFRVEEFVTLAEVFANAGRQHGSGASFVRGILEVGTDTTKLGGCVCCEYITLCRSYVKP